MSDMNLTIGAMATQSRCSVPTIRYYEHIELLPPARRSSNGHRFYQEADLKRLLFIKRCRDFGFSIEQVRALVSLFEDGDRACIEVRDLAQTHLNELRTKLAEMRELERNLVSFIGSCNDTCSNGTTSECVIIEDLSASASVSAARCCATPLPDRSATVND